MSMFTWVRWEAKKIVEAANHAEALSRICVLNDASVPVEWRVGLAATLRSCGEASPQVREAYGTYVRMCIGTRETTEVEQSAFLRWLIMEPSVAEEPQRLAA